MGFETKDGRDFTRTKLDRRESSKAPGTDEEEARILAANIAHDAAMKALGRGFYEQTLRAMGGGQSRHETDEDTKRLLEQAKPRIRKVKP